MTETADVRPEELVEGDTVRIGRGSWLGETRVVDSAVKWRTGLYRVEFTDGTTRYYDQHRLVEVEL